MKSERLDVLSGRWDDCALCAPMRGREKVFWRGDPDSPLVIMGEAPGPEETDQGRPFVGPAGRKLDEALEHVGLFPADVFVTNMIACEPPGGRAPIVDEIRNCSVRLQKTLRIVKPKVLLLLGATAARFAGVRSVAQGRGKVHIAQVECYDGKTRAWPAYVTFHPAVALRGGSSKTEQIAEDVHRAWQLALARRDKTG